ncbi:hypothetical protein [Nannocystis sp. SCPEA4]|uniref:hypothetical protein n=1 Tax=Nannocystis sp. SCPEA4 TaxID=2996787 RepID=UPI00226D8ECC|nr:hypothetical protein [Nannocystis sp. SCPEA4]MCY1054617.1 hypothetical protein [Nannocystis sp. SCPEA4]
MSFESYDTPPHPDSAHNPATRPSLAEDPRTSRFFRMVLGSMQPTPVALPWLDAELAVFVAVNREPGADLGIALDYRTSREDPRVVASDWWSEPGGCCWRVAAPTFSAFVAQIGLCPLR